MNNASNSAPAEAKPPRRRFFAALAAAIAGAGLAIGSRRADAAPQSGTPLIGELMLFAGNFAPNGWLPCDGRLLNIIDYESLFYVIGTTYGGDGLTTYALPDLRGRTPIHSGQGAGLSDRLLGEMSGSEQVTLTTASLPAHSHSAAADANAGSSVDPTGRLPARDAAGGLAWGNNPPVAMAAAHLGDAGVGAAHENRMPYLTLNYCIAWTGTFPSQN